MSDIKIQDNWCKGCRICVEMCPGKVLQIDEDAFLRGFHPVVVAHPEDCYVIGEGRAAPCQLACPARLDVQGYVTLISEGRFKEALELIRERIPFPAVCGRVCHRPCESECNRGELDEPLAIAVLKRFVADYEGEIEPPTPAERTWGEKVAVIGAGPAGLTAAYDLVQSGYGVTVFEALPVAGGMLTVGIPAYRLPRDVLQAEIKYIEKTGVEIRTNTPVGGDLTLDDLCQEYDAVFISVGAHKDKKLAIPGEDLEGVLSGVSLLRDLNLGKEIEMSGKVAVIGGGNVAVDAARSALRLGAEKVSILYRRSRAEMPANEWEIEDAEEEGVEIHYLVAPTKILGRNGKVVGLECVRMELGEPDESGRRRPIPIEGSEFTVEADVVVSAIGQVPDLSFLQNNGLETTKWETIAVDTDTLATSGVGIFAGGDAVSGPATAIEAIAAGKKVALSIHRYLRGEPPEREEEEAKVARIEDIHTRELWQEKRQKMPKLSVGDRVHNFEEVEMGFSEEMAVQEASRCLECTVCRQCELLCPDLAIVVSNDAISVSQFLSGKYGV
jgi:NADPH-dependent glutamate synthase beta subunit-like oxidoreductase